VASSAQAVAGLLCDAGVLGIVNFAPVNLKVPQKTPVIPVDISQEFLKWRSAFSGQGGANRRSDSRSRLLPGPTSPALEAVVCSVLP